MCLQGVFQLLHTVRVSYRLLLMNSQIFTELWDWSCFLNLIDQMADLHLKDGWPLLSNILDLRWCTIQIISVALKLSDRSTRSFGMGGEEAFTCLLRLVLSFGFRCLVLLDNGHFSC